MAVIRGSRFFVFGHVGDQTLGGEQQCRDGGSVLKRAPGDLGRVNDTGLDEVGVFLVGHVVAGAALALGDALDDHGAFQAGVAGQFAQGRLDGVPHDVDTDLFVALELQLVDGAGTTQQGGAASGHDTFLDGRAGGMQRVLHTRLLLLHLALGCGADIDDGHTTGEFSKSLLELLAVVVRGGLLDLAPDLVDTALDLFGLAAPIDDDGVLLLDGDVGGAAEVAQLDVLEL